MTATRHCTWPIPRLVSKQADRPRRGAALIDNRRVWVTMQDIDLNSDDFPRIGADFERTTGLARRSRVGEAQAVLMPQRSLVDYGVQWIEANRR